MHELHHEIQISAPPQIVYEAITTQKGIRSLDTKARFLRGEMEHLRLREFQPGLCRYVQKAG